MSLNSKCDDLVAPQTRERAKKVSKDGNRSIMCAKANKLLLLWFKELRCNIGCLDS